MAKLQKPSKFIGQSFGERFLLEHLQATVNEGIFEKAQCDNILFWFVNLLFLLIINPVYYFVMSMSCIVNTRE